MRIKVLNKSQHPLPEYSTALSAGMDLRANLDRTVVLQPLERALIPTGLYIELPRGLEVQVRPRSGLALKNGISMVNATGTVDADYRGEIQVVLINLSKDSCEIKDGERIGQMVLSRHELIEWEPVKTLSESDRGKGGFGHTGTR